MEKEWKEEYNLGIKIIDEQHREIFESICELDSAAEVRAEKEAIDGILTSILEVSRKHFECEEGYFKEFGYGKAEEHAKLHDMFENRIEKLREKYEHGQNFSEHLAEFFEEWLVHHIHDNDRDFVELFHEKGL